MSEMPSTPDIKQLAKGSKVKSRKDGCVYTISHVTANWYAGMDDSGWAIIIYPCELGRWIIL